MQKTKRLLALFLCMVMLFTTVPVNAFATGDEASDETVVTEAPEAESTGELAEVETEAAEEPAEAETEAETSEEAALPELEASEDAELVSEEEADINAVSDTDVARIGDTGYATLADAVAAAAAGDTIYLLKDAEFSATVTVTKKITITAESAVTMTKTSTYAWLTVNSGGDVTLEGPVTVAGTNKYGALIEVGSKGILTMNDGVTLKDNETGKTTTGGAVNIKDGTFTMNGGTISNCKTTNTSKPGTGNGGGIGGAVRVSTTTSATVDATFIMNGGLITGCSAYGGGAVGVENVKNSKKMTASFVMNGGTITGCSETGGNNGGAAVLLWNIFPNSNKTIEGATFTMNGGKIVNNTGKKYGVINPGYNGLTSATAAGHIYILGGEISGNFVGKDTNNSPSSFYGNGIYLANVYSNQALLTVGGNAVIDDEIFIANKSGNFFEVRDDFTGTAKLYSQTGGIAGTHGTLVAKSASGTASAAVAGRIVPIYGFLNDAGDRYEHPDCGVVVGTKAGEYVLGEKGSAVPEYTVTYTDGVDGEEIFADQTYTVEEGAATPAFDGTPEREGYTFAGWDPTVADTVTGDATYTATWKAAAKGEFNGVTFRGDNEGLAVELQNLLAYESVQVKVYYGETPLTTVSWREDYIQKGVEQKFLTASVRTGEEESTQWAATEWTPYVNQVPTKLELFVDGVKMDELALELDAQKWADQAGVKIPAQGEIIRAWLNPENGRLMVDLENLGFEQSVVLELYSGETLLTSSSLNTAEYGSAIYAELTGNIGVQDYTASDTWPCQKWTAWDNAVPTAVKLVIDGQVIDVCEDILYNGANGMTAMTAENWAAFPGTKALYTVTYTDGVEDAEIFADQTYIVEEGKETPAFEGETPAREGYSFEGWEPAVAQTVTGNVTYVAQWKENARGDINGVVPRSDNNGLSLELHNVLAYETIAVKVYSGETLLTTVSLRDIEENKSILGAALKALTVSIRTYDESSSWVATEWEPADNIVPDKYELYIDGVLMDTHEQAVSVEVWNALEGTKAPPVARLESTGEKFETLQAAIDAATALMVDAENENQTITILNDLTESVKIHWAPGTATKNNYNLTIDLNGKTVTGNGGPVFDVARYTSSASAYKMYVNFNDSVGTGKVTGGTAEYGGAIYVSKSNTSYVVINGGTWTGNTATKSGGAISSAYTSSTFVIINGGTFTGNTAGSNGGAIYARNLTINGGTITGNSAASGGGVYVFVAATTTLEMTGGAIYGNTATTDGDDIIWRANKGNTSTAYMKLIAASEMGVDGVTGWYKDDSGNRYSEENAVEFTDYAKYTTLNTRVALKAACEPAPVLPEQPALPANNGSNVTSELITIVCDTDEGHTAQTYGWGDPAANIIFPVGSEPVWNEELNAWTIGVRIDSIQAYYVGLRFNDTCNGIQHEVVMGEPLTSEEYKRIDTTLVWDAQNNIWNTLTGEPFEVHTACQTMPEAPQMGFHLSKFQIKVVGMVNGEEKVWHESLHTDTVTVGEVKGNRTEGFTVDVTVALDDSYVAAWIAKHAEGLEYVYAEDTAETATFTMKYTGNTAGELYDGPEYWTADGNNVYTVNVVRKAPDAPDKYGKNVTAALVRVICDSDENHAPVDIKWQHQSTKVRDWVSGVVWSEEENTWVVPIRIDSISVYYVWMNFDEVYNDIEHEMVDENQKCIDTYLKWDAEQELWVNLDEKPIEVHVTCKTAPVAPTASWLGRKSFQIQVMGDLDGDGIYGENGLTNDSGVDELFTTTIPAESYTISDVYGSREEGFFVDVTVTLEDGDIFIRNWIEKRAPGESYVYNWDKTQKTVSFTLKYTGSLTGTLYGSRESDWVHAGTDENFGKVGEAYVGLPATVTYTDGVENAEVFADQSFQVMVGDNTPAFEGTPVREGYTFTGWNPEVAETVTADVTYVAQWQKNASGKIIRAYLNPTKGSGRIYVDLGNVTYNQGVELKLYSGETLLTTASLNTVEYPAPKTFNELTGSICVVAGESDTWPNTKWTAYDSIVPDKIELVVDGVVMDVVTVIQAKRDAGAMTAEDWAAFPNTLAEYTVTYTDGVEGEEIFADQTYTVVEGEATPAFEAPAREGYTFAGWTPEVSETVTADAAYTATWTANEYKVTFNTNGGAEKEEITVTYDGKYPALNTTSLTGFTASDKNWYLVDEDGNVTDVNIKRGTVVTTARDHELFLMRDIFVGAVKVERTPAGTYVGTEYTLTATVANLNTDLLNYTYQWYKDGVAIEGANEATLVLAGNYSDNGAYTVTVTATKKDTCTVVTGNESASKDGTYTLKLSKIANTLRLNENYGEKPVTSDSYTGGNSLAVRSVAERVGYTFLGWNTAADGSGTMYQKGDTVTFVDEIGNGGLIIELFAQWKANEYKMTLNAGDGAVDPAFVTVAYETAVGALPVPTFEGYTFAGWFDAEGKEVTAETVYAVLGDSTVTAAWTANTYTLTLDAGEGTVEPATVTVTFGTAVGELPEPTLEGYTFVGWTDAEGNSVTSETVFNSAADATLTAVWEKVEEQDSVIRIFGADRYETAMKAADVLKAQLGVEKFNTIVVACGTDFADALSGSYLANQKNAPILLVRAQNVEQIKAYIRSNLNAGGTVYLLGGVNAVPKSMETGLDGFHVKRLGGATRYDTNLEILKEAGINGSEILVCTGKDFADGLSASAVNKPILLVKDSLTTAQTDFLKSVMGSRFYIIGGTVAISERMERAISNYGQITRIEGATRYYTSANIAKTFFANAEAAVLAYGANFPDGLSGGAVAYSMGAPLILTAPGKDAPAVDYTTSAGITNGAVLGGKGLINDATVRKIFNMAADAPIVIWGE